MKNTQSQQPRAACSKLSRDLVTLYHVCSVKLAHLNIVKVAHYDPIKVGDLQHAPAWLYENSKLMFSCSHEQSCTRVPCSQHKGRIDIVR
jgi:hypothetical protein